MFNSKIIYEAIRVLIITKFSGIISPLTSPARGDQNLNSWYGDLQY